MASDSAMNRFFGRLMDKLNEQTWFQELRGKWEELDAKTRMIVQLVLSGAALLGIFFVVIYSVYSVHSLKQELADKNEVLSMIQSAGDEMRALRMQASGTPTGASAGPWPAFFETTAASSGIDKSAVSVSEEKSGAGMTNARESLFDISLKNVNVRQLVRYAFWVENGGRPVKLRNLTVDTREDLSGYMDASLAVSAFTPKEK
jgi:hypothetical protein